MNTVRIDTRSKRGSVLLTVVGLVTIMLLVGIGVSWMTAQAAFTSRKMLSASRALAIAEAGVADVLAIMSTNYNAGVGIAYSKAFGDGEFSITTALDETSGNVLISSTGVFDDETRTTRLELMGDMYAGWNALMGNAVMVAQGDIILSTSALRITGRVHANGNIIKEGGANPPIEGNLTAGGTIGVTPQSGFVAVENHPQVSVPTYFPLDDWKAAAQSGGLYYSGNQDWRGVNLQPGNGIVYVEGDVVVNNNSSLEGTLVASGSITINNRFNQTQVNTDSPAMLAGVNINLMNRNNYTGVIWAGNNIVTRNNKTIDGALIALNNIDARNQATLDGPFQPPVWTPGVQPMPEVIVGGWLE